MSSSNAQLMSTEEAMRLPQPKADQRIAYGKEPQQFGELRLPKSHPFDKLRESSSKSGQGGGPEKSPVAIVIHGGCWSAEYDLGYMSAMSAALAEQGMVTWTIEYRRVGDPEGGWPGTFLDVAAAADYVLELAERYPIDVTRVIAIGHSAGGHLALWLAARHKLAKSSELYLAEPIGLRSVVSLAGIPDLIAAGTNTGCGDMGHKLMGGTPEQLPDRYRQGSPAELLPLGVKQVLIHGEQDQAVPHGLSVEYAARARRTGDNTELVSVRHAGHFELVVPTATAWTRVRDSVIALAK